MITKHSYDSVEEIVITGDTLEEVQETIMQVFEEYPEQLHGTSLIQEPYETLARTWKAVMRRWTHNDIWTD